MKKILAVLIAISMVATMAFAADVHGVVRASVTLADGDGNFLNVADVNDGRADWGSTGFSVSVSDDKAGASINLDKAADFHNATVWFKPIDEVKVTVGSIGFDVAGTETINYGSTSFGATGAELDLNIADLSVAVLADSNAKAAFDTDELNTDYAAKVAYKIGDITVAGVFAQANNKKNDEKTIAAGVNYKGNFVNYVQNIDAETIKVEAFGAITVDALSAKAYVPVEIKPDTKISPVVYADYAIDAYKPYAKVTAADITNTMNLTLKAGVKTSVGMASLDCGAEWKDVTGSLAFSMPFSATIGF